MSWINKKRENTLTALNEKFIQDNKRYIDESIENLNKKKILKQF